MCRSHGNPYFCKLSNNGASRFAASRPSYEKPIKYFPDPHTKEPKAMKRDDFFRYGDKETEYLKRRDKRLAKVIEKVGKIERTVIPDLFAALVHSIVGQQISTRAHETIWARMKHGLREITPQAIDRMPASLSGKRLISNRQPRKSSAESSTSKPSRPCRTKKSAPN